MLGTSGQSAKTRGLQNWHTTRSFHADTYIVEGNFPSRDPRHTTSIEQPIPRLPTSRRVKRNMRAVGLTYFSHTVEQKPKYSACVFTAQCSVVPLFLIIVSYGIRVPVLCPQMVQWRDKNCKRPIVDTSWPVAYLSGLFMLELVEKVNIKRMRTCYRLRLKTMIIIKSGRAGNFAPSCRV